jgi:hypothetical protein
METGERGIAMADVTYVDFRSKKVVVADPPTPVKERSAKPPAVDRFDLFNERRAYDDAEIVDTNMLEIELMGVRAERAAKLVFVTLGNTTTTYRILKLRETMQDWSLEHVIHHFRSINECQWSERPYDVGALALELRARILQAMSVLAIKHSG